MINNVISVWKPPNITSFDVLRYIKTIVKTASTIDKLISKDNKENIPKVITTS